MVGLPLRGQVTATVATIRATTYVAHLATFELMGTPPPAAQPAA